MFRNVVKCDGFVETHHAVNKTRFEQQIQQHQLIYIYIHIYVYIIVHT